MNKETEIRNILFRMVIFRQYLDAFLIPTSRWRIKDFKQLNLRFKANRPTRFYFLQFIISQAKMYFPIF